MDIKEQNNDENKIKNFLNINETQSYNCANEAPPIQFYNDINNINNENKNINSEYDSNKITDPGNEPKNNEDQIPIFDKPQNQTNLDNQKNINIPNNDKTNKINIPSPFTNNEINEPFVIPQ